MRRALVADDAAAMRDTWRHILDPARPEAGEMEALISGTPAPRDGQPLFQMGVADLPRTWAGCRSGSGRGQN